MLIDLHAHSAGISLCCRTDYKQILHTAQEYGIDGIVLTNHYQKCYVGEGGLAEFVEKYIAEYVAAYEYGKTIGCKVFFGIEVTTVFDPHLHLLIYGVDTDFLRKYPALFDYTPRQLRELVNANNGILIQAHPFRNGSTILDLADIDGVEINCHPLYQNAYSKELLDFVKGTDLIITCGGDYHADTYRPKCGMFLPDDVQDTFDVCAYLRSDKKKTLCIQEVNSSECWEASV